MTDEGTASQFLVGSGNAQADHGSTAIAANHLYLQLEGKLGDELITVLKNLLQDAIHDLTQSITILADGNLADNKQRVIHVDNTQIRQALLAARSLFTHPSTPSTFVQRPSLRAYFRINVLSSWSESLE